MNSGCFSYVKEVVNIELDKIYLGDCLTESDKIESSSIDLILTDLPYGIAKTLGKGIERYKNSSNSAWDNVIEPEKIYKIANRILRKNGKMILFAQQPFTTQLIKNAIHNIPFSYTMFWDKLHFANCLSAKKAPVNYMEEILVFSKNEDTEKMHPLRKYFYSEYEKTQLTFKEINRDYLKTTFDGGGGMAYNILCCTRLYFTMPTQEIYSKLQKTGHFKRDYTELKQIDNEYKTKYLSTFNLWQGNKYKSNILKYKKDYNGYHPTQKPLLLLEDLVKTFSNENDTVVDLTMGSGSTIVACINTNRRYLGFELDTGYFNIAKQRIKASSVKIAGI